MLCCAYDTQYTTVHPFTPLYIPLHPLYIPLHAYTIYTLLMYMLLHYIIRFVS